MTVCVTACVHDYMAVRMCRLHIVDNTQPLVDVEGFADYSDVQAQDLVPWTPLKAGGYTGVY